MNTIHVALKFIRDPAARLTETCNQVHALCEQLRSKKDRHCAWSIQQDVIQALRMQKAIPCSWYGALLVRGQVLESAGTCPFLACRSLSAKVCGMEPKASLMSNNSIYSVFQLYMST